MTAADDHYSVVQPHSASSMNRPPAAHRQFAGCACMHAALAALRRILCCRVSSTAD
jgi:hypothetical protein